jgi:hypothetical protein
MTVIPRPGPGEFAPTSAGTIGLVPEGGLLALLERQPTLALVRSLDAEAWTRMGTARDKPVSASAVAHILAGHAAHHLAILEERYIQ